MRRDWIGIFVLCPVMAAQIVVHFEVSLLPDDEHHDLLLSCTTVWDFHNDTLYPNSVNFLNARDPTRTSSASCSTFGLLSLERCQTTVATGFGRGTWAECAIVNDTLTVAVKLQSRGEMDFSSWSCLASYTHPESSIEYTMGNTSSSAYTSAALVAFPDLEMPRIKLKIVPVEVMSSSIIIGCEIVGLNQNLNVGNDSVKGVPLKMVTFFIDDEVIASDLYGRTSATETPNCRDAKTSAVKTCPLEFPVIGKIEVNTKSHTYVSCGFLNTYSAIVDISSFVERTTNITSVIKDVHSEFALLRCSNVKFIYRPWTKRTATRQLGGVMVESKTLVPLYQSIQCFNQKKIKSLDLWKDYQRAICTAHNDYGFRIVRLNHTHTRCEIQTEVNDCPAPRILQFQGSVCRLAKCESTTCHLPACKAGEGKRFLTGQTDSLYDCAVRLDNSSVVHLYEESKYVSAPLLVYNTLANGAAHLLCSCHENHCKKVDVSAYVVEPNTGSINSVPLTNTKYVIDTATGTPSIYGHLKKYFAGIPSARSVSVKIQRDYFMKITQSGRQGVTVYAVCFSENGRSKPVGLMTNLAMVYELVEKRQKWRKIFLNHRVYTPLTMYSVTRFFDDANSVFIVFVIFFFFLLVPIGLLGGTAIKLTHKT